MDPGKIISGLGSLALSDLALADENFVTKEAVFLIAAACYLPKAYRDNFFMNFYF